MNQQMQVFLKAAMPLAVSFSVLAACSPTNTPTTNGSPSTSPTASTPVATPTPGTTPTPGETTSPTPTATPTGTTSSSPGASDNPSATPTPAATATATATSDISVVESTTLNGKVYDDTNAPLDGVTITAKSLNTSVPFEATATTAGGSYAFNNAPSGVTIEITATRAGYTTRRRVEVLKSNKTGDPNANRYDFGTDGGSSTFGTQFNSLSDKPEVNSVTPGRNSSGISPTTSFVLKFSEPMDRATVQDAFEVIAASEKTFTVDSSNTFTVTGNSTVSSLQGAAAGSNATAGTKIWDKAAFNVSWNSDDTEATFTFKEERQLPTDKDSDKTPDYKVTLSKGGNPSIKDKSGVSRDDGDSSDGKTNGGKFKLTDGGFEKAYKFAIATDTKKPTLNSVTAQTNENQGTNGDAIKVQYSERMIHYTLGPTIAGGMGSSHRKTEAPAAVGDTTASEAAENYVVSVVSGSSTILGPSKWSAFGGTAVFDTNDPTHHTVLLLPPTAGTSGARTVGSVASGASLGTFTVTFSYTDGSSDSATSDASTATTYTGAGSPTAVINNLFTANGVTFTETSAGADGNIDANDTYTIGLQANSTRNSKTVSSVTITGAPAAFGISSTAPLFAGVAGGTAKANIYKPGDNVVVRVESTVLDPAGNSIDTGSNSNSSSANAS